MRLRVLVVLAASFAALLILAGGGSAATRNATAEPTVVVFDTHLLAGAASATGTVDASGAVTGSGTAATSYTLSRDPFAPPPHAFRIRGQAVFSFGDGTLVLRFRGRYDALDAGQSTAGRGRWHIASGTGAYAQARGSGYWAAAADFTPPGGGSEGAVVEVAFIGAMTR